VVEVGTALRRESAHDRLTGVAAELAFFAVLAIFPGLLALASTLAFIESVLGGQLAEQSQRVVMEFLDTFLTDQASGTTNAVRSLFEERNVALLSFAMVGVLWSMVRGARGLIRALNVVYDVEDKRPLALSLLVALLLSVGTLLTAAVVLAAFVLGPLLGGGRAVADAVGLGGVFSGLWTWLRIPVASGVMVAWLVAVFHLAPNRDVALRHEIPGAVFTAVLWVLVAGGFRLYLDVAGGVNQILGVIGGFLVVLLWVYLLSLALLLGGELNAVLLARRAGEEEGGGDRAAAAPAGVEPAPGPAAMSSGGAGRQTDR
jgi:membrane protein